MTGFLSSRALLDARWREDGAAVLNLLRAPAPLLAVRNSAPQLRT
jgi:hypothetical protein